MLVRAAKFFQPKPSPHTSSSSFTRLAHYSASLVLACTGTITCPRIRSTRSPRTLIMMMHRSQCQPFLAPSGAAIHMPTTENHSKALMWWSTNRCFERANCCSGVIGIGSIKVSKYQRVARSQEQQTCYISAPAWRSSGIKHGEPRNTSEGSARGEC